MTEKARFATRSAAVGGVYEFRIAGTVGPLTRAAFSEFESVVIPRFTVLTGTCSGPDELRRLLAVLETQGPSATAVRVITGNRPSVDPNATTEAVAAKGPV